MLGNLSGQSCLATLLCIVQLLPGIVQLLLQMLPLAYLDFLCGQLCLALPEDSCAAHMPAGPHTNFG